MIDLEEVWRIREEEVYPEVFGPSQRGIFPLEAEMFTEQFRQPDCDPLWLHYGVFEFGPTAARPSWLYVTSGLSNPWDQAPADYGETADSGAGIELTFASTEPGDWAVVALQSMLAFEILLLQARFEGQAALAPHDRIPLGGPINGEPTCLLRNLVVAPAEGIVDAFQLPSGKVRLLGFTGLTDAELAYAKANGSGSLIDLLRLRGAHPINDPRRLSLV